MSKSEILAELPKLTQEERYEIRVRLAEMDGRVWLDADDPLDEAEKNILQDRLALYERDPGSGDSWEKVFARLRSGLKK